MSPKENLTRLVLFVSGAILVLTFTVSIAMMVARFSRTRPISANIDNREHTAIIRKYLNENLPVGKWEEIAISSTRPLREDRSEANPNDGVETRLKFRLQIEGGYEVDEVRLRQYGQKLEMTKLGTQGSFFSFDRERGFSDLK